MLNQAMIVAVAVNSPPYAPVPGVIPSPGMKNEIQKVYSFLAWL
jgi:hypothetical protein